MAKYTVWEIERHTACEINLIEKENRKEKSACRETRDDCRWVNQNEHSNGTISYILWHRHIRNKSKLHKINDTVQWTT